MVLLDGTSHLLSVCTFASFCPLSTAIGFVLSLLGSILLFIGPLSVFAILYVLGTVISLIATGFLIGFGTQLKLMFKSKRIIATVVLFASMVLVFVGAFVLHIDIFCLIFVIIQYLAFTYYSLTYIPGATSMIKGLVGF
ncbi:hypothetical protein D9757_001768 [Collybiopsis confluens]|uniref:Protein transport protein SFT2 n=1 Tax=Collybiopsis confluens TaxID=2823264 RepID=A0A8H5HYH3_9AGAR|nr:hypothetical protein D9757_001768 [Collybiopsis confluens]